jgi:hypothetical protein
MPKKITTEQFIERAKKVHGDRYDYSSSVYCGSNKLIEIICKKHGAFEQTANSHLSGSGCSKCVGLFMDKELFIQKANKVHDNKYFYHLVDYVNALTKVQIMCPTHGVFEQSPNSHLSGRGCKKCVGLFMDKELFVERASEIHKGKYDYSLVEYRRSNMKIKIICPTHGIFEQSPSSHLNGHGCPKCGGHYCNQEIFIEKANKRHKGKYDYSLTIYRRGNEKIKIICPIHGAFEQLPGNHLRGSGCPVCGIEKLRKK